MFPSKNRTLEKAKTRKVPLLKDHWDTKIDTEENIKRLGLTLHPNRDVGLKKDPSSIVLFDVPESDVLKKERPFPLTIDEETYMAKCLNVWGTNYKKMFFDIKTNDMQYTEAKLRKLASRYLLLHPNQRRVEVPERVQPLIDDAGGGGGTQSSL